MRKAHIHKCGMIRSSFRTTCPREVSLGKIYAKRLCRTSRKENIILQVNLLMWSSGSCTCSKGLSASEESDLLFIESVPIRSSHLWKYHYVLLLRPASFSGPCLHIQAEHPFIRTSRLNKIDELSLGLFSFTCSVLHFYWNDWICCCYFFQPL